MGEDEKKIKEEYSKQLVENPGVIEIFKDYTDYSFKMAVNKYAQRIMMADMFGGNAMEKEKKRLTKFIDEAEELLKAILIMKIFHKQCEWRAGMFNDPRITLPDDIEVFMLDPYHCDFIEPITEHEMRIMQQFIASEEFDAEELEELPRIDYHDCRKAIDSDFEEGYYPYWFEFYDEHMGTGHFMQLPDIRGEKLRKYFRAYYKTKQEEYERSPEYIENEKKADRRLILSPEEEPEIFRKLDDLLQPADRKIKLKYYDLASSHDALSEKAEEAYEFLSELRDVQVPVKESDNWQEALIDAMDAFNRKTLADALAEAFNSYATHVELNIKFPSGNKESIKFKKSLAEEAKRIVLKGKALFGEPENFDFLEL